MGLRLTWLSTTAQLSPKAQDDIRALIVKFICISQYCIVCLNGLYRHTFPCGSNFISTWQYSNCAVKQKSTVLSYLICRYQPHSSTDNSILSTYGYTLTYDSLNFNKLIKKLTSVSSLLGPVLLVHACVHGSTYIQISKNYTHSLSVQTTTVVGFRPTHVH